MTWPPSARVTSLRIDSRGLTNDAEFVLGDDWPAQLFLQPARLHR
jgi:hypothetical protein